MFTRITFRLLNMHPTPIVSEPGGTSKAVGWFRRLVRNVTERTVIAGRGINIDYQAGGAVISAGSSRGKAGDGGTGVTFRGDWSPTEVYSADDWVFFAQGNSAGYETESRIYSGLYRSKVAHGDNNPVGIPPGTDAATWERIADGPRDEEQIRASDRDEYMEFRPFGLSVPSGATNNVVLKSPFIQGGVQESSWRMQIQNVAESDASLSIDGDDFVGLLTVRDIYLSQGGVLLQAKVIMTEPVAVDLSTL